MGRWPLLLLVATLLGCGQPQTGGTSGTESDNALTIRAFVSVTAATPPDWKVLVWPDGQLPDTLGTAPLFQDSAGANQVVDLRVPPGRWSVLVRFRNLGYHRITSGSDTLSDTLRPLQTASGTVVGDGGEWILLPGLGRAVKSSAAGIFQIDSLPTGTVSVAVRHRGRTTYGKIWVAGATKADLRIVPDSLDGGWIGTPGP